jgi:hypothetical protein
MRRLSRIARNVKRSMSTLALNLHSTNQGRYSLPSQQRRCTYCDDGVGKHLDFRLLVALEVEDEAGYSMEVWIRHSKAVLFRSSFPLSGDLINSPLEQKALLGIYVTKGTPTDLDHQDIVQIMECKNERDLRRRQKEARGKVVQCVG